MLQFAITHWRGGHRPLLSLFGVLIGLGTALHFLFGLIPRSLPWPLVGVIISVSFVILIWQVFGTLRSCERGLKGGGDMILYWGCYGASTVVALVMVFDATTLVMDTTGANPAPAQKVVTLEVRGDTIFVEGFIGFRTHTALRKLLQDSKAGYKIVRLNSDGGRIFAARAMANALILHDINTEVVGRCASACTLVFLAGTRRTLLQGGQIGFHQYLQTSGIQVLNTAQEQEKDRAYFKSRGVTDGFIAAMFQAEHKDIWFPDHASLKAAKIITD